jgi:GT2 family glycosyltransferase
MPARPPADAPTVSPERLREADVQPQTQPIPFVSIVIPHLAAPQLDACLSSIFTHGAGYSFEVIVVFDGSPSKDVRQIQSQYRDIRVIILPRNNGFARACNEGAGAAFGQYLVFLNDDTTVTPDWLDRLVDFIDGDPQIGIAGPKLLYPETDQIQHCGTVFNEHGLGEHIYRHRPSSFKAASRPRNYRAITAACVIIERDFFLHLGGFDIRFHRLGGCEDTNLCFNILKQGRTVSYCPDGVVYHHEGMSRGLHSASRPEEVYNQKLLRQRWERFLVPDIEEYDLLADIEEDEGKNWRWLRDVPDDVIARKCKKLHAESRRLAQERDALSAERDRLLDEHAADAVNLGKISRERDTLSAERDRLLDEHAADAVNLEKISRERDAVKAANIRAARDRDDVVLAHFQLIRQRDELASLLKELSRECDAHPAERERLTQERDAIAAELWRETQLREAMEIDRARLGARLRRTARLFLSWLSNHARKNSAAA